ncbi:uncharacterized protein LOC129953714 isoform X2 [Eupeodes corollae]|uniref:uncharacterized protein LOC129953714 isoform X2 n=1 Tax=Eupeodes corollae TaxID=290404 RepID=UPI0024927E70|nr:uncharacterized protein LOC129953714 isoform X2 [Eupeodes corollae]
MPIQLDKILADIADEKPLHPQSDAAKSKKDQDEAWIKVGKKNKLSAHEAKSIFKVLQKKYEQEKLKPSSTWKLFQQMEDICKKQEEFTPKLEEEVPEHEDESMVEFLEVREEDDDYEGDSDNQDKSMRSISPTGSSPEKETTPSNAATTIKPEIGLTQQQREQQKQQKQSAFSKALQNKGISLRKANTGSIMKQTTLGMQKHPGNDNSRAIIMPESVKRKLQSIETQREDSVPSKKMHITQAQTSSSSTNPSHAQVPEVEIKKETIEEMDTVLPSTVTAASNAGINVITIPSTNQTLAGELSNGMTTIKSNGFNSQLEELDFQKDIIFENNPTGSSKTLNHAAAPGEIINIGNFDNQLPPTFFKNLCNSNRHEALGLYVANVMNRVSNKTAAKLEINILKAIIEAQSDEYARL